MAVEPRDAAVGVREWQRRSQGEGANAEILLELGMEILGYYWISFFEGVDDYGRCSMESATHTEEHRGEGGVEVPEHYSVGQVPALGAREPGNEAEHMIFTPCSRFKHGLFSYNPIIPLLLYNYFPKNNVFFDVQNPDNTSSIYTYI